MEDNSVELVELKKEINAEIDRYVNLQREVNAIINKLDDADQVTVIQKRYFEYKTWEQISCEMRYSYRNVCNIHGKALQAVAALMEGGKNNGEG
jgi:DNA-directed RNA polymerase specialized sigma subunit